jgi:hypothetical protein
MAVSLVPPEVEAPPVGGGRPDRTPAWAGWLVAGCYLLGALAVTIRLWVDPASRIQSFPGSSDSRDVDLFAWFLRDEATALAHGRLPALVSTAMNAPHGISMLWNTSLLLPGIVLSPVTLLAGPQTSLTLLLTLGFAGSATSLFLVLRRWGASLVAAALAGAMYGFSPALLDAGLGHYHMAFAVFPPLIIHVLLRLITGRGRPVWNGVWLGVLAAAQLFTGEELLVDTAVAAAVIVVVVAAGRLRAVPAQVKGTVIGLATAAVVALVLCGYALWEQLRGPLSQHGSPWPTSAFYAHPSVFITPPLSLLFHTSASAATAAHDYATSLAEYLGYVGLPLFVVLVAAAIFYWRDPKIRAVAVTCAVLELFTLGGNSAHLPWHYLQNLPVLSQLLPDRLAIPADAAAAAVLAFSLDRVRASAPRLSGWRARLATGVAVLALLPLVPLPYQADKVTPGPAGWQTAFGRLHLTADAPVLIVPVPYQRNTDALRWQAQTGDPGSLIEGYFIGPNQFGHAKEYGIGLPNTARTLDEIWAGEHKHAPSPAQLRTTFATWRPAAIVAVASPGSRIGRILIGFLGPPDFRVGRIMAWRR